MNPNIHREVLRALFVQDDYIEYVDEEDDE